MLIVVVVVAALIAAGATVWALTNHSSPYDRSGNGCVNVSYAGTMGGALEHACGQAARDWCRAAYSRHDPHAEAVAAQCKIAGIFP
ncbi:MAG: hypothetical protein JO191_10805 [Mycobacteriaceae bacterium]|nr:hypothetical protein [Mycobacteriaceae bacterium]MBV9514228.1 hypothetical protein [Mycobacteriaceae bacterium]